MARTRFTCCLIAALLLAPVSSFADGAGSALPADAPTVVLKGDAAPFNGVLTSEQQFQKYLNHQINSEACDEGILARDQAIKDAEHRAARGWFERHGFALGVGVGVVVSVVVIFVVVPKVSSWK